MRQSNLKIAMAEVDNDFSAASAAADAAIEEAAQEIETALETIQTEQAPAVALVKPRIKQARAWAEKNLDLAMDEESKLQAEMADATRRYESTVASAAAERDAAFSRISAELDDITALRAAVAVFKGELVKVDF